jgi:hypothetical protein
MSNIMILPMTLLRGILGPLELDENLEPAPYTTTFTGTTVMGVAKMAVLNNKLTILEDPKVEIDVQGLDVKMQNLFGGQANGLAKVVLKFVNKESDKFIRDFQPEIAKQVSKLIKVPCLPATALHCTATELQ